MIKKMITVKQWESGDVDAPVDNYIAVESFSDLQICQIIAGCKGNGKIVRYEGAQTGTILSPDFSDILEL